MYLSIWKPKTTYFPFVPNGKLMVSGLSWFGLDSHEISRLIFFEKQ